MAEDFPVTADRLKKLVKQSLRMPIPFGFNPGGSDEGDEYLAAHPRKPPELMGKIAMHGGEGNRSAFGTFAISDRELHLTCFRLVPNLAKRFKRFLKANRIVLNVVVMDETGAVVDSDVEDLAEAFDAAAEDDDAEVAAAPADSAPATEAAPAAAAAPAPAAARPRSIDPAVAAAVALSDRLKRLHPQVLAAPAPVAGKLATLFRTAVAMVREGRLKEGGAAIAALEGTFAKIARAPGGTAAPAPAAAPRDPRLAKLREALLRLEDRAVRLLGEDGAEAVLGELEPLAGQIDLGEGDAVRAALAEAQTRIAELARARRRWEALSPRLAGRVEAALAAGAPPALRQRWKFVAGLAAVGDWPRALAAVPGLVAQLRDAAAAAATDPARARALWQAALAGARGGDRAKLLAAGAELEAVLAALESETDGAGRRDLQDRARRIVAGARAALAA